MAKIHLLKPELTNKIAAGEVVESPASVIKELVENAIDAKADQVSIEIEEGGLLQILVSDNGIGMDKEDLLLSPLRYATSKISSFEELTTTTTMGFRGEALASISSISNFLVRSSTDGEIAFEMQWKEGDTKLIPKARKRGTDILVKDLFYNVPARRAFQKKSKALTAEVTRFLEALSLCYPKVNFTFISNGKKIFTHLPSDASFQDKLKEKVRQHMGEEFYKKGRWISFKEEGFSLRGFLGPSSMVRANRLGQFLFVNQRWIISPMIGSIIKESYGTEINERAYPYFVLHIDIDPKEIDINVHPQKKEIRLKDPKKVRNWILSSLWQKKENTLPSLTRALFEKRSPYVQERVFFEEAPVEEKNLPIEEVKLYQPVALIGKYLFIKEQNELYCFHTERALGRYFQRKEKKVSQKLLIPHVIELRASEIAEIESKEEIAREFGFEIGSVGKSSLAIYSVPPFIKEKDVREVIYALLSKETISLDKRAMHLGQMVRFDYEQAKALFHEMSPYLHDDIFRKLDETLPDQLF